MPPRQPAAVAVECCQRHPQSLGKDQRLGMVDAGTFAALPASHEHRQFLKPAKALGMTVVVPPAVIPPANGLPAVPPPVAVPEE